MIIRMRHSATSGNVPSSLSNGELALNRSDQLLFYKHANGSIAVIANGAMIGIGVDQFARDHANGAFNRANVTSIVTRISSNANQYPLNTNPYIVTFNSYDVLVGASYSTNTASLMVNANGMYMITVVGEVSKSSGGGNLDNVDYWLRKNGVNLVGSGGRITIENSNAYRQITLSYTLQLQSNDSIQLVQAINVVRTNFGLRSITTLGGPIIPSISLTILRVFD